MDIDVNPYRELDARINPTEFEVFCMETLKAYAERENLQNFSILFVQSAQIFLFIAVFIPKAQIMTF